MCERDDAGANLWAPFDGYRAMRAITAAYLLGDREGFDRLVEYKTRLLNDLGRDFELGQFRAFADRLIPLWASDVAPAREGQGIGVSSPDVG